MASFWIGRWLLMFCSLVFWGYWSGLLEMKMVSGAGAFEMIVDRRDGDWWTRIGGSQEEEASC